MTLDIEAQLNEETKDSVRKSNFYKLQEGDNKLRILSEGAVISKHFFGKGVPSVCYGISKGCPFHGDKAPKDEKGNEKQPSIKYTCYILDRIDNAVKLADLPYSVIKKVGEMQKDEDYAFDSFPMPYDIKITYKKDEAPNKMYTVLPSPKREELSDDILAKVADLMVNSNPKDLVQKQKERQMQEHIRQGIWIDPSTMPGALSEEDKEKIRLIREAAMKPAEDTINADDIPF